MTKTKIINIMSYPPAYELFRNEPRPEINFDTSNGFWIGIWGRDVPDLLGTEIFKLTDEFEYEVWQPDLRADRIYGHAFNNGLVRKHFPAIKKRKLFGAKLIDKIYSNTMVIELIKQNKRRNLILHLNGDLLFYKHFISTFAHLPVIFDFRGTIFLPYVRFFSRSRNLPSKFNHIIDHFWLKKNINKVDYIIYRNNTNIKYLSMIYSGILQKLTSGCDFSFWHSQDRKVERNNLGLPEDKIIFFLASRMVADKQIDKVISVFSDLSNRYDFLLLIAGHGPKRYEDYLEDISLDLLRKNKIRFVGFLSGEKFRSYYNASDFFISASTSEGASVAVMNAFACEVPVISTKTGHTAELMEQYNCGCLLDIYDYKMWKNNIEEIMKGKKMVRPMDREIAKKHYDWPNIARKFADIYVSLAKKYYSK